MIDYVQHTTPHAKIDIRRFRGIGWDRGEVAASRACFLTFFSFLSAPTEQSMGRGLTLNAPQKRVLVVSIFLRYNFCQGSTPHLCPKNRYLGAPPA